MRLISLHLFGEYKQLKNQHFEFNQNTETQSNVIAFIGLNGSGKSQLLELIGEIFAYIERVVRPEFKTKTSLGFGFELIYSMEELIVDENEKNVSVSNQYKVRYQNESTIEIYKKEQDDFETITDRDLHFPIIVGYSSGLNQNLQRSFMKNTLQYYQILTVKRRLLQKLSDIEQRFDHVNIRHELNQNYLKKKPHLFSNPYQEEDIPIVRLAEKHCLPSAMYYIDYDTVNALLLCAFLMDSENNPFAQTKISVKKLLSVKIKCIIDDYLLHITDFGIQNFLKELVPEERGKKLFTKVENPKPFRGRDARIKPDTDVSKIKAAMKNFCQDDPLNFFQKFNEIQQFNVKTWRHSVQSDLKNDNFFGGAKKPINKDMPVEIQDLKFQSDSDQEVSFDDLSDGEAQLTQILAMIYVFSQKNVLFLFDEPETHLNPAWRTSLHQQLLSVMDAEAQRKAQIIISTHSPFMVSSLDKSQVFSFQRHNERVYVTPAQEQTFGASFDGIIKQHFHLDSTISQTTIAEIRQQLQHDDKKQAYAWIQKNLGASSEKTFLLGRLKHQLQEQNRAHKSFDGEG